MGKHSSGEMWRKEETENVKITKRWGIQREEANNEKQCGRKGEPFHHPDPFILWEHYQSVNMHTILYVIFHHVLLQRRTNLFHGGLTKEQTGFTTFKEISVFLQNGNLMILIIYLAYE